MDNTTTISELKDILKKFRDDRDWLQFHDPKNLAEALSIEAAELLERFLWQDVATVQRNISTNTSYKQEVADELADVINYCLQFALVTDIDIATAVKAKVAKAEVKYPISKIKGKSTKRELTNT